MKCPRCGNEWDATKGACTRCGFVVRTAGQSGTFPNQPNVSQRSSQPLGGLSSPAKQQSGRLASSVQPGFPVAELPITPVPTQRSNYGLAHSPSQLERTFPKPTFEKNMLQGSPQSTQQTGMSGTDSVSYANGAQGQGSR